MGFFKSIMSVILIYRINDILYETVYDNATTAEIRLLLLILMCYTRHIFIKNTLVWYFVDYVNGVNRGTFL